MRGTYLAKSNPSTLKYYFRVNFPYRDNTLDLLKNRPHLWTLPYHAFFQSRMLWLWRSHQDKWIFLGHAGVHFPIGHHIKNHHCIFQYLDRALSPLWNFLHKHFHPCIRVFRIQISLQLQMLIQCIQHLILRFSLVQQQQDSRFQATHEVYLPFLYHDRNQPSL